MADHKNNEPQIAVTQMNLVTVCHVNPFNQLENQYLCLNTTFKTFKL